MAAAGLHRIHPVIHPGRISLAFIVARLPVHIFPPLLLSLYGAEEGRELSGRSPLQCYPSGPPGWLSLTPPTAREWVRKGCAGPLEAGFGWFHDAGGRVRSSARRVGEGSQADGEG